MISVHVVWIKELWKVLLDDGRYFYACLVQATMVCMQRWWPPQAFIFVALSHHLIINEVTKLTNASCTPVRLTYVFFHKNCSFHLGATYTKVWLIVRKILYLSFENTVPAFILECPSLSTFLNTFSTSLYLSDLLSGPSPKKRTADEEKCISEEFATKMQTRYQQCTAVVMQIERY